MAWEKLKEEKDTNTLIYLDKSEVGISTSMDLFNPELISVTQLRSLLLQKKIYEIEANDGSSFSLIGIPTPSKVSISYTAAGLNISLLFGRAKNIEKGIKLLKGPGITVAKDSQQQAHKVTCSVTGHNLYLVNQAIAKVSKLAGFDKDIEAEIKAFCAEQNKKFSPARTATTAKFKLNAKAPPFNLSKTGTAAASTAKASTTAAAPSTSVAPNINSQAFSLKK
jgi:hypothetical protein